MRKKRTRKKGTSKWRKKEILQYYAAGDTYILSLFAASLVFAFYEVGFFIFL